jgi:hypothetical protein
MAVELAMLQTFNSGSTPQDWALSTIPLKPPYRQRQSKAHHRWCITIACRRHIMQTMACQSLHRQMSINGNKTKIPRHQG